MMLPAVALVASLVGAGGAVNLPMPPPPAPRKAPSIKLTRVILLDLHVTGDVPDRARAAFVQSLHAELRKLEAVSLLTASEIREILNLERSKQLLGCNEMSADCMAELAGAADASESLGGDLSLVAHRYTLTLRRTNLAKASVQSKTRTLEQRDGEELLAVIGPMVEELYPDRKLLPGKTRGVSAEVVHRLNPPPLPRWLFFTTAGAGALAGVAGSGMGLLSQQTAQQHNALAQQALDSPVSGAQLSALRQQATSQAQLANVLFAGAGALALGAAIEIVFTDWSDERAAPPEAPRVSAVPLSGGGMAAVSVSF
jgi:hypothetical protein